MMVTSVFGFLVSAFTACIKLVDVLFSAIGAYSWIVGAFFCIQLGRFILAPLFTQSAFADQDPDIDGKYEKDRDRARRYREGRKNFGGRRGKFSKK